MKEKCFFYHSEYELNYCKTFKKVLLLKNECLLKILCCCVFLKKCLYNVYNRYTIPISLCSKIFSQLFFLIECLRPRSLLKSVPIIPEETAFKKGRAF